MYVCIKKEMQERSVRNVNNGYLTDLCSSVFFLPYIFVNDLIDFTMNIHELKNWKRRNAILIAHLLKGGEGYIFSWQ